MAFSIDKNGNITMIQGDSGSLSIEGLNTDKNYTVYLAIYDKNRIPAAKELYVNTNKSSSVIFELTGNYTDMMNVGRNEDYAIYYYGIKLCSDNGYEDTLLIGDGDIGSLNTIIVYPKKVEGSV